MKIVSVLVCLLLAVVPLAADTIVLTDGTSLERVTVSTEDLDFVEYRERSESGQKRVKTADVRDIVYSQLPADFKVARGGVDAGKLGSAAQLYLELADDTDVLKYHRANALIWGGDAFLAISHWDDAADAYDTLLAKFPKSRHVPHALWAKARALIGKGDAATANETIQALRKQVTDKKLDVSWSQRSDFLELLLSEVQGKPDLAGYESLRGKAVESAPDVAGWCGVRLGRHQLAADDLDKAERSFERVIDARLQCDVDAVAGAFNGRGRCRLRRAQQAANQRQSEESYDFYNQALFDFLRVHVSYTGVPGEQAEAMYHAAIAFENLRGQSAGTAEDYGKQAASLLKRTRTEFPDSPWAAKAAESR